MPDQKYSAPAAGKLLDILEFLVSHNQSFSVTEIAHHLGITVNSAFRILKELESKYYITKDPLDNTYTLTDKLYYIGSSLKSRNSLVRTAHPHMQSISNHTSETVLLASLTTDHKTLIMSQVESPLSIKFVSTIGCTYDSHHSALGKAILAFSDERRIAEYLEHAPFEPLTPHTLCTKDALLEEFRQIRDRGVSYDREESVTGLFCIACPILLNTGMPIGSIGLSGIAQRLTPESIAAYTAFIKEEALTLSKKLGRL